MTILNRVAIATITSRLDVLNQERDRLARILNRIKGNEGLGWLAANNWCKNLDHQINSEIGFLTNLSAMLSNTPEPSAKIENPEGDGAPAV
ncbi:hypothetical protein CLV58_101211 [Spirosoma oryzae]|uniref:Uncharacterized protein n=1 Tax=Spirosoma oryzae TaxID=1469603 RepID=A0A2T0TN93_9BACT|nr:hypothetical protein [Spirosoma oryzae]PRY47145.1 hypothetical protein CLV58_101211 [Spirosoma oryzae]